MRSSSLCIPISMLVDPAEDATRRARKRASVDPNRSDRLAQLHAMGEHFWTRPETSDCLVIVPITPTLKSKGKSKANLASPRPPADSLHVSTPPPPGMVGKARQRSHSSVTAVNTGLARRFERMACAYPYPKRTGQFQSVEGSGVSDTLAHSLGLRLAQIPTRAPEERSNDVRSWARRSSLLSRSTSTSRSRSRSSFSSATDVDVDVDGDGDGDADMDAAMDVDGVGDADGDAYSMCMSSSTPPTPSTSASTLWPHSFNRVPPAPRRTSVDHHAGLDPAVCRRIPLLVTPSEPAPRSRPTALASARRESAPTLSLSLSLSLGATHDIKESSSTHPAAAATNSAPGCLMFRLHREYLVSQSSFFRSAFGEITTTATATATATVHGEARRVDNVEHAQVESGHALTLTTPPAPAVAAGGAGGGGGGHAVGHPPTLHLPLGDIPSFVALLEYLYLGDFGTLASAMDSNLVRWENVILTTKLLGLDQTRRSLAAPSPSPSPIAPQR
ncbi:hypothetical protein BCV70DRAFT_215352 [Testicularia cyperi]|uniref:BTB domain-containing protein n=1 Tax=Testicularia cyperi TaxID=1882483 RepID=A0A317XUD8_9BASI|nr:hypothetical protein BCV70DRAFT_215352 [Testicularia cyperi]